MATGFGPLGGLAVEGRGKGSGQSFFANPHGALEEKGVPQPPLFHGAVQHFFSLVLADDFGKRKSGVLLVRFHARIIKGHGERRKMKGCKRARRASAGCEGRRVEEKSLFAGGAQFPAEKSVV